MNWPMLAIVLGAVGYGLLLGGWAGCRYQRARDAARYAMFEQRRSAHVLRLLEQSRQALANAHAETLKKPASITVQLDYDFAVAALLSSGFDVTPTLERQEMH